MNIIIVVATSREGLFMLYGLQSLSRGWTNDKFRSSGLFFIGKQLRWLSIFSEIYDSHFSEQALPSKHKWSLLSHILKGTPKIPKMPVIIYDLILNVSLRVHVQEQSSRPFRSWSGVGSRLWVMELLCLKQLYQQCCVLRKRLT